MNKKGVIEGLQALIVPLIAIGILLMVAFLIFAEAKTQVVDITSKPTTYINETVTWSNETNVALTNANCMTLSCSEVLNGSPSSGVIIPTSNYTCGLSGIMVNTTVEWTASINVTYACANTTAAYNATGAVQNATQDIPGWLPIIVITIIGALLIGLVARFRRG